MPSFFTSEESNSNLNAALTRHGISTDGAGVVVGGDGGGAGEVVWGDGGGAGVVAGFRQELLYSLFYHS